MITVSAAIEDSTVKSVGRCLHIILFLFTPLNLKVACMYSTAYCRFDLDNMKIHNVKLRVVLAQSLNQYCKNDKLVEMPETFLVKTKIQNSE